MLSSPPVSSSRGSTKRKLNLLADAVAFFVKEQSRPKVRGNTELSDALSTIEETARDRGLSGHHINKLVNVAASGRFAQTTSVRLIKALIPSEAVPCEAVLRALSWMCTNSASVQIQSLLIRWILLIYDSIDDRTSLHAVYEILFCFLENESLCPHICHLLYLLTNKEDVLLCRVQKLLALQHKRGAQPYIIGLLSIYKLYCPNLVAIVIPRSKFVCFRLTDRAWRSAIQKIKDKQGSNRSLAGDELAVSEKSPSSEPMSKRGHYELVPGVKTSTLMASAQEHIPTGLDTFAPVPFEQIRNFKQLLKCLDRVELRLQIGSCLEHHLLQHLISLLSNKVVTMRFSFWLHSVLHDEFLANPDDKKKEKRTEFLKLLLLFTDFLQEGVPVCEIFLIQFLHTWNGRDFLPYIFKLITKLGMYSFEVLNDLVLEPVRKLYFSSSLYFKCQVVTCFTEWLRNLALLELPRYLQSIEYQKRIQSQTSDTEANFHTAFSKDVEECNPYNTLLELVEFIDDMCVVGLQQENNNTLLLHCVLDFFQLVSMLYSHYGAGFIKIPSSALTYRVLFSHDALAISKFGHIMCNYRIAFSHLKTSDIAEQTKQLAVDLGISQIPTLNIYIKDLCNALWQKKAFVHLGDQSVFDPQLAASVDVPNLGAVFSFVNHQAFLPFTYNFLLAKEISDPTKTPQVISKEQRLAYLDYLQQHHLEGFKEFISTYIRPSATSSRLTQDQ